MTAVAAALAAVALVPFTPTVEWRQSVSHGSWWDGRLAGGVTLPAEGRTFFTWDPVLRQSPNREWRRHGSDRLVRLVLRVLDEFAAAHPDAPRIGIGDLSRPRGGDFGIRYGRPGHVSHQNGLDADLYYPRRDGKERPPARPAQIDRPLAQDLVDRFVRAGAVRVFVGPQTRLTGPRGVVQVLPHHDNHLHVRLAPRRRFENRVFGHTVGVPPGWDAAVGEGGVTVLTRRGSSVSVVDFGRPRGYVPRPAPLRQIKGGRWAVDLVLRGHHIMVIGTDRRAVLTVARTVRLTPRADEVANERSRLLLGRSHEGRPIRAWRVGNPRSPTKILVVGCIHGDECAGMAVTLRLLNLTYPIAADLWVVQNLNPDGLARGTRRNARNVDLNRNFPSEWRPTRYSGSRPLSEREARIAYDLVLRVRPDVTIWFHQPQAIVRAWGPSIPVGSRYARLTGERYRSIRWPNGTASNWQNHRFPGAPSFVVELPAGALSDRAARRHVAAILALSQ